MRIFAILFGLFFAIAGAPASAELEGPSRCALFLSKPENLLKSEKLMFGGKPVTDVRMTSGFDVESARLGFGSGEVEVLGEVEGVETSLGFLKYKVSGTDEKILTIDVMSVVAEMRGQALGGYLAAQAFVDVTNQFSIHAIVGTLNSDNYRAYVEALRAGSSADEAWLETPAYRIRRKLGFGRLRLDRCDEFSRRIWTERDL